MSDFRLDARRRHGKRQTIVIFEEAKHSSTQSETDSSGKVVEDAAEETLSKNRAGSRERPDKEEKRTPEWNMLAESSHEMISKSGTGNEFDENWRRGHGNKICF